MWQSLSKRTLYIKIILYPYIYIFPRISKRLKKYTCVCPHLCKMHAFLIKNIDALEKAQKKDTYV